MLIGILAFQGDYSLHKNILNRLNIDSIYVNNETALEKSDALIIPGGESTVISKFLIRTKLNFKIKEFSTNKSIFGTCAGGIIMSSICDDTNINVLDIINIKSFRNSWGKQIDSFESKINLNFCKNKINAKFIRAPKIEILSKNVKILSTFNNEPILVRNNKHLVSTFHPELNNDLTIHKYFIDMI